MHPLLQKDSLMPLKKADKQTNANKSQPMAPTVWVRKEGVAKVEQTIGNPRKASSELLRGLKLLAARCQRFPLPLQLTGRTNLHSFVLLVTRKSQFCWSCQYCQKNQKYKHLTPQSMTNRGLLVSPNTTTIKKRRKKTGCTQLEALSHLSLSTLSELRPSNRLSQAPTCVPVARAALTFWCHCQGTRWHHTVSTHSVHAASFSEPWVLLNVKGLPEDWQHCKARETNGQESVRLWQISVHPKTPRIHVQASRRRSPNPALPQGCINAEFVLSSRQGVGGGLALHELELPPLSLSLPFLGSEWMPPRLGNNLASRKVSFPDVDCMFHASTGMDSLGDWWPTHLHFL